MARRSRPTEMPAGFARLLGLLVLSGFAGIALEIAWFRRLHLVLGSESYSIALVLAAFMAGLGIGSAVLGRVADRTDPVRLYRFLELGIGIYGLASPFLLRATATPYVWLRTGLGLEGAALLAAKFALSFLLLLPPTLLMGGTLPAAARALTSEFAARGRAFAYAYGVNALGAGIAALASPFLLLPRLGLTGTTIAAACCNLAVFALARGLRLAGAVAERAEMEPPARKRPRASVAATVADHGPGLMQVPFFLTGFVALAAETVWNRVFSLFFTSSVYTFSLILSVYLATLAAGSLAFPLVRRKVADPGVVFAGCQMLIAVALAVSTVALDRAPLVLLAMLDPATLSFGRFFAASATTLVLFTAPITFLFGLAFPAGVAFATSRMPRLGGDIGRLLLWNTVGTAVASIVVTLILFETLGSRTTLIVLAALMTASHLVVGRALRSTRHQVAAAATLAVVVVAGASTAWHLPNFHLRLAQRPQDALAAVRGGWFEEFRAGNEVRAFEDGPAATVSVVQVDGLFPSMFINGKPDASETLDDMRTQYLVGLLPVLFRDGDPRDARALVVGLGAGVTANAVDAAGVRDLTTVEISPKVVDLADRYFRKSNEGVVERTRVVVDDGRDYLSSSRETWDVVISEPSNPWISGVSNLFTDEYFEAAAAHLAPGGVFGQWMHYYSTDIDVVYGVIATLRRHFSEVHAFLLAGDLVFVAANEPLAPRWERFAGASERVRAMLATVGFEDPTEVFRNYLWTPDVVARLPAPYPPNTDDRPWLEFDAPRFIFDAPDAIDVRQFVGRIPDAVARAPLRLPPPPADRGAPLEPFALDLRALPAGYLPAGAALDVRWSAGDDGNAAGRAWLRARFEASDGSAAEFRSPMIRAVPSVEDAVAVLRADLGPTTRVEAVPEVHGHTAIGARSPERPGRSAVFWYCPPNRRSYVVERDEPGTAAPAYPRDVATCIHAAE